jgi:hypothetical protein
MTLKLLICAACLLALVERAAAGQEGIRLTITEPAGANRPRWPVTCGLPFPKGLVKGLEQLHLLGPDGSVLPAQWAELGRWLEDGSLRGAACSFVADFQAGEKKVFTVTYARGGAPPEPKSPVTVSESEAGYVIANGIVQVLVRKKPFSLIDQLSYDADGDGRFTEAEVVLKEMSASVGNSAGETFTAGESTPELQVLERGPVRALLRAKGKFASAAGTFFSYDLTLTVYAGSPLILLSHRIINTEGQPEQGYTFPPTPIKDLQVSWRLARPAESITYSVAEPQPGQATAKAPFRIAQTGDAQESFRTDGGDKQTPGRFPGWLNLALPQASLVVGVEDFWQRYPKAMAVTKEGVLRLELIPGPCGDFAQGMAATHNLYFLCHSTKEGASLASDFGELLGRPLIWTNPEWFSQSGILGAPFGTEPTFGYDEMVDRLYGEALRQRESLHLYGLKNFGCWIYGGDTGYGQNQYNTVLSLLLQFLRTGDYRYFQTAREHFYHLADVDTCHYATHPWDKLMLGGKHAYAKDHTTTAMTPANAEGAWDSLVYYYLTGDPYAYETARGQADAMLTFFLAPYDIGRITPSERDSGIPLFELCELYKATGDKRYLEGAKKIVDYRLGVAVPGISEEQREKGRQDPVHGCWHYSYGQGACTWITASSLLPGLVKYYQITGEERAKEAAVKAAYWVMNTGWDTGKQQLRQKVLYQGMGGPLDPTYRDYSLYYGGIINLLSLPAFQYGYELTGDEKFLTAGTDVLRSGIRDAQGGRFKEFGQASKWTPFFLYHLEKR